MGNSCSRLLGATPQGMTWLSDVSPATNTANLATPPGNSPASSSGTPVGNSSSGPSRIGKGRIDFGRVRPHPESRTHPVLPQQRTVPTLGTPGLSEAVIAKFGCEMEMGRIDVFAHGDAPPPTRGTALLQGQDWTLETDNNGRDKQGDRLFDPEVVFKPLLNEKAILQATKEVVDLFQAVRNEALTKGEIVPLTAVAAGASPDYSLKVRDIHFGTTLQATYGVKVADLGKAMENLLVPQRLRTVQADTEKVADHYAEKRKQPLPEGTKEFARLINMYLECGSGYRPKGGATVHAAIRMMSRSDFCSIYERLLDDEARAAAQWLLTTPEGLDVPPFLSALGGKDSSSRMFPNGYSSQIQTDGKQVGPTVSDWLRSIVNGRGEGEFRKDLASPPPGYALHSGDLSKDYGMGAMGVDSEGGHVLFEVRGAPSRPQSIPMNGQMIRAVRNEIRHAALFNGAIELSGWDKKTSKKYELLKSIESCYDEMKLMATALGSVKSRIDSRQPFGKLAFNLAESTIGDVVEGLNQLRPELVERASSKPGQWAEKLATEISNVLDMTQGLAQACKTNPPSESFATLYDAFVAYLPEFEKILWEAGQQKDLPKPHSASAEAASP